MHLGLKRRRRKRKKILDYRELFRFAKTALKNKNKTCVSTKEGTSYVQTLPVGGNVMGNSTAT